MPPTAFGFLAALLFEAVTTVGVGMFALAMGQGVSRSPWGWAVATMAGSFAVHRVAELVLKQVRLEELMLVPGGTVIAMAATVGGSIVVGIAAPFVLWAIMPNRPLPRS